MTRRQEELIKEEQEITLGELWGIFRNHILSIILAAIIIGAAGFSYSQYLVEPLYTSSVTLYVASNNKYAQTDTVANAQTEYKYTTEVINTYIEILKTKSFFEEVASTTNGKYAVKDLEKKISIQAIAATEVIKVSVTTENAEDSYNIAMKFAELSSGKIESVKSEHFVKIVDPPMIEEKPSNDRTLLNTAIGMLLGGMIAYMTFLVKSMLDKKIKVPEDLSSRFDYPVLGVIPDFTKGKETSYTSGNEKKEKGKRKTVQIAKGQTFAVQESYKALRSNINFSITNKGCKTILITSALPAEGKTTTCAYLAEAIAQTDAKVLLIDADLRNPRLHTSFEMKNERGLSNIAAGMCISSEAIIATKIDGLEIITAGDIPPNPSELLNNQNIKIMLTSLKEKYDYIIIDTPPLGVVSDAFGLVNDVDGFILVAKAEKTEWPILDDVIYGLEFAKAKVSGFVLNGFIEQKTGKYGYKYHYKYKYKYKY